MSLSGTRPTALVSGAAGFLGSHLVDRLLSDGYEVVGLDNLMTGDLRNLDQAKKSPHFHFQIGDVREPLQIYASLVFNLACPASPIHYQRDPYATLTSSVLGAIRLVDMARGRSCRIVHASTSEVYGDPQIHPQKEDYWGHVNPIGARSCYDEGKRAAETLFSDAKRSWGLDVRIARIFNTYGPRMAFGDGRVVSNFILQALRKESLTIYGDGEQSRSFCYVGDLVDGLMMLATSENISSPINLGNDSEYTMKELAQTINRLCGSSSELIHLPLPEDDPVKRRPDLSRARTELGYEPKYHLENGLMRTIADFQNRLEQR